jgi:hypothetical protein
MDTQYLRHDGHNEEVGKRRQDRTCTGYVSISEDRARYLAPCAYDITFIDDRPKTRHDAARETVSTIGSVTGSVE